MRGHHRYEPARPSRRLSGWPVLAVAGLLIALIVVLVWRGDATSSRGKGVAGRAASGTGATAAAPAAGCAQLSVWLCLDFEATAPGSTPAGWTASGPVAVAAGPAHSGDHALEAAQVARGARLITTSLAGLGRRAGEQWGRLFFRIDSPAPFSATQILHSTLVGESALSPLHADPIEVRPVGIEGSHDGKPDFQFLYNVQPAGHRAEFATLSPFEWSYDSAWHCAEWHLSYATQSYQFFIDGREVTSIRLDNGPGRFAGTEIPPAYRSISIGWTNYRTAAVNGFLGYHAWLDDFALNGSRVGCR